VVKVVSDFVCYFLSHYSELVTDDFRLDILGNLKDLISLIRAHEEGPIVAKLGETGR
jgi:hypothetical protein